MSKETTNNVSLVNLPDLPESVDNALKNITDEPTKSIGHTISDIWELVFGGISHAAAKKRVKYALDLEKYRAELTAKIDAIPIEERKEPSLQVTAQALENSKFCISEPELRSMFVNLISSSMDIRISNSVHPSFPEMIKQMTPLDAKIISDFKDSPKIFIVDHVGKLGTGYAIFNSYVYNNHFEYSLEERAASLFSLQRLGLIKIEYGLNYPDTMYNDFKITSEYSAFIKKASKQLPGIEPTIRKGVCELTPLGTFFIKVCLS